MCMCIHAEVRLLYWAWQKDCIFFATPGCKSLAQFIRVERRDGFERFDSFIGHSQEGFSIHCKTPQKG